MNSLLEADGDWPDTRELQLPPDAQFAGRLRQSHTIADQAIYLTAEGERWTDRQHLYLAEPSGTTELSLPNAQTVTRPRILRGRVLYEYWNPWAVSATQKIRRYVSSWSDKTLRPEASLHVYDPAVQEWKFVMPGHTLVPSPDGKRCGPVALGRAGCGVLQHSPLVRRRPRSEGDTQPSRG